MSLRSHAGLVILLLFSCVILKAQGIIAEKITIDHGLSQGMIYDLMQTRDGFLWVATKDGLNRYDGYNFKVFSNNPFEPYSLAENEVTSLFEDSRGWLWIGLKSKGVDIYHNKTGRFHHFTIAPDKLLDNGVSDVVRFVETADGAIWLATMNGQLFRITPPAEWMARFPEAPSLLELSPLENIPLDFQKNQAVHDLALLPGGDVLVASSMSLYAVSPKNKRVKKLYEDLLPSEFHRFAISGDIIWLANNKELWRIAGGKAEVFPIPASLNLKRKVLVPYTKDRVWFFVNEKIWELQGNETINFNQPDFQLDYFASRCIVDKTGNIWLGTNGYGLRKITPLQGIFRLAAAGYTISGIWAGKGRYFARHHYEIRPFNPQTGVLSNEIAFKDAPNRLINLVLEPNGDIWLLCTKEDEEHLARIRKYKAGRFDAFEQEFIFPFPLSLSDPVLRSADGGQLWIAGNRCKLARFDTRTGRVSYADFGHLFGERVNAVRAATITQDGKGVLWIGTQMGLVKCVPSSGDFQYTLYQADANNRQGLNNNSISCVLPDPSDPAGTLWICTKGGGINLMNTQNGQCRHITTANGLINNVIYGILPGGQQAEFWCSSNRGLARLLKQQDGRWRVSTYTASIGLQGNEFNTNAFYKNDDGELLFGGVNGLNRFFPNEIRMDGSPPQVVIVGLEINHQPAILKTPVEALRVLRLPYHENNLSFEFSALDFTDPSKNRYRYRLEGLDADWVIVRSQRFAHFNHLAPGQYRFLVEGGNDEGDWQAASPIVIIIRPPWWRSDAAYLIYLLLLIWGIRRAYLFQIRRVKMREQMIYEHRENQRVRALEQLKTNFFNNVTHEFRTPLTLMIEPLRQILPELKDPRHIEKVKLAEKNSRKLLALVNQLLDMAKMESGNMSLNLKRGNLSVFLRELFETFLPLAEKKNISLVLKENEKDLPEFEFDADKVGVIVSNLVSNALKFTPAGGKVSVSFGKTTAGLLEIVVKDTGPGIPAEEQEKIFDRFYQIDGSFTREGEGTGIGLALSREFARLMNGDIVVCSIPGNGAAFTFSLPLVIAATQTTIAADPDIEETAILGVDQKITHNKAGVVLIVEDNTDLRYFIRSAIETNWTVVEASDGEEGVKKAIALIPDLVVSDLMMPRKDGYALCDELKRHELTAHIPIILLTAKAAMDARLKGLRIGADDYLSKPFHTAELIARIDNLIETRRKLRELWKGDQSPGVASETALSGPDLAFIRKFSLLISQHLSDETLGVEEFASKMQISRVQLHRKLKAIIGHSATDFIRDYRLERAYAMLKNKEGNINEVASLVGFGNEKYFSTVFKEKYGIPPSKVV